MSWAQQREAAQSDRSTLRDAEKRPDCSAATAWCLIVQQHTACVRTHCCVVRQDEGDSDHARMHQGSVSMKDGVFVESLLHITGRQNRDSVCVYSIEEGSANPSCEGPGSK